ncbi:hypothetical protein Tco_1427071 [Tanacetum coccineum]
MKTQEDKHRSEREFAVSDWVYLKLQPHRQVSMRMGKYGKLAPKYYGSFQVQAKVGAVAYKLDLPVDPADATWEPIEDIQRRFPEFIMLD